MWYFIFYMIGFFGVPTLGVYFEKKHPGVLKLFTGSDDDWLFYYLISSCFWPIGLIIIYFCVINYYLKH